MIDKYSKHRIASALFCFSCVLFLTALAGKPVEAAGNVDIERTVRETYADIPVLIEIARCESGFRHYGADGAVLRSGYGDSIIGVMQLHATYHSAAATARGLDLTDLDDHLAYARYLYEEEGTAPWSGSRSCWQGATTTAPANRAAIEQQIRLLMIEIYKLQIQLLTLKLSELR